MPQTYTFASWNVNGLRAVLKKDPSFIQIAQELDVDILALQETKLQEGQVDIDLALLQLCLLQCQDINVKFLRNLDKARVFFEHSAQAVDVPRGESVSLRHGVLSTGLAGLRLTQLERGGVRE